MIVYQLSCGIGHSFEAWFASIAAFDEQSTGGKLVCPLCNSRSVAKAPMAPALAGVAGKDNNGNPVDVASPLPTTSRAPGELHKMRQFMTGLRKFIEQNAEYVGPRFPEEARKIHYGEGDQRHIYGEASLEEAADLVEEGIDVAPLPPDPNEIN